jgi:hypothetical protein
VTSVLDDDKDRAYEAVYKEAVRALDLQRAALDVMRTRVGFLMSAATIATSFLGGLALKDRAGIGGWVAIVLFAGFGGVALRILWPRAEGADGFTASASETIDGYIEGAQAFTLGEMYRDLALYAEVYHNGNRDRHLVPLTRDFRIAISLLALEILAWVVDLAAS